MLKRVTLVSLSLLVITPLQLYAMEMEEVTNTRRAQLVALHNLNARLPAKQTSSKPVTPCKLVTNVEDQIKAQAAKIRAEKHGNAIEIALWNFDIEKAVELYKDGASVAIGEPLFAFLHEWRELIGWQAQANDAYHHVVSWLVENGAKVNAHNNLTESPLQLVLKQCQEGCCAKALYEAGAQVGPEELRLALFTRKRVDYLAMMLGGKRRVDIAQFKDQYGNTPFDWVFSLQDISSVDRVSLLELLHKNGAPINVPERGIYPLHKAVRLGQENSTLFLLQQGALINAVDKDGQTPLSITVETSNVPLMQMLLARGAEITPAVLSKAAQVHNVDALREFFGHVKAARARDEKEFPGISITQTLFDGKTLLHVAAVDSRKERFHPVDLGKKHEVICFLLAEGCPLDGQDKLGDTPLVCAIKAGDLEGMLLLLNHGADFAKPDFLNKTPLDHAQEQWVKQQNEYGYNKLKYELEKYIKGERKPQFSGGQAIDKKQGLIAAQDELGSSKDAALAKNAQLKVGLDVIEQQVKALRAATSGVKAVTFEDEVKTAEIRMLQESYSRLKAENTEGLSLEALALRNAELKAMACCYETLLRENNAHQTSKDTVEINK